MGLQDLQRIRAGNRGRPSAIAIGLAVLALAGCARDTSTSTPIACTRGEAAARAALARAPGDVRLGGKRISECFVRGAESSAVQEVGIVFVPVAARLADDARSRPAGPSALRLGFLMGAIRRGVADTQGIYSELLRRLRQELIGVNLSSPAYLRGLRAGSQHG
jgi:hypothetical protein